MATWKDVYDLWQAVKLDRELFGAEEEFQEENERLFHAIGEAYRQDCGLPTPQVPLLERSEPLTPTAEARFEEWKAFLQQHGLRTGP